MKADILADELGTHISEEFFLKLKQMFEISGNHILCPRYGE